MTIPQDPIMLYSYINMKLRNEFSSIDDLCLTMNIDKEELINSLRSVGFEYNKITNKFI